MMMKQLTQTVLWKENTICQALIPDHMPQILTSDLLLNHSHWYLFGQFWIQTLATAESFTLSQLCPVHGALDSTLFTSGSDVITREFCGRSLVFKSPMLNFSSCLLFKINFESKWINWKFPFRHCLTGNSPLVERTWFLSTVVIVSMVWSCGQLGRASVLRRFHHGMMLPCLSWYFSCINGCRCNHYSTRKAC